MQWLEETNRLTRHGVAYTLVTVVGVEGSAPRSTGAKMVVTVDACFDTIGGGNLEYQAIARAREMMTRNQRQVQQHSYTLGQDLSQCCGGRVSLVFEVFPRPVLDIALFGAGHVGQSLATILAGLDCRLNWFDSRPGYLPETLTTMNTTTHLVDNPCNRVETCNAGSSYLVMTHSHDIDFELIEGILSRSDIAFCGLIASRSKAASFRHRLRRKGFTDQELSRLVAPVGSATGGHKEPMAVAVSIVSQLLEFSAALQLDDIRHTETAGNTGATD